jgi:hypothetical protein
VISGSGDGIAPAPGPLLLGQRTDSEVFNIEHFRGERYFVDLRFARCGKIDCQFSWGYTPRRFRPRFSMSSFFIYKRFLEVS